MSLATKLWFTVVHSTVWKAFILSETARDMWRMFIVLYLTVGSKK